MTWPGRRGDDLPHTAAEGAHTCAVHSGSFERDTLTWAFARLGERSLDHLFGQPSVRARYGRWLLEEAPRLAGLNGPEQGLFLTDLELEGDGHYSVVARPTQAEFILVARHERFHMVMASYYGVLTPRPEQEYVCVAHFEGDPQLAARWASGLRRWLESHWPAQGASVRETAIWRRTKPAEC
jgi:hypothetical protein